MTIWIWLVRVFSVMFDHGVSRNVRLVPRDLQLVAGQPLGHVIILPAPAPVLVGESVHQFELLHTEGGDSTEEISVWQLVLKLVHRYRHVAGLLWAAVEITIVLRQQVDIVEHQAVPGRELHCLPVANIEEHRSVENFLVVLRYHEYSITTCRMKLIKQIISRTYIVYSASSTLDVYV